MELAVPSASGASQSEEAGPEPTTLTTGITCRLDSFKPSEPDLAGKLFVTIVGLKMLKWK